MGKSSKKIIEAFENANVTDVVNGVKNLLKETAENLFKKVSAPKSIHTYNLEMITRRLMTNEQFNCEIRNGVTYLKFLNGDEYNFTQTITHANLDHLKYSQTDFKNYELFTKKYSTKQPNIISANMLPKYPSEEDFKKREENYKDKVTLDKLSYAEKLAVNIYSTKYYTEMNPLLRGTYKFNEKSNSDIRDVIIHTTMCAHALNHITPTTIKTGFRYENSNENVTEKRKAMVGRNVTTTERGFISTGEKPADKFKEKECRLAKRAVAPTREEQKEFTYSQYILTNDEFFYYNKAKDTLEKIDVNKSQFKKLGSIIPDNKKIGSLSEKKLKPIFKEITSITGHTHQKSTVAIIFRNLKGLYIAPLSEVPYEGEFLQTQTQVKWEQHTKGKDGTEYFVATPAVDLRAVHEEALRIPNAKERMILQTKDLISQLKGLRLQIEHECKVDTTKLNTCLDRVEYWANELSSKLNTENLSQEDVLKKLELCWDALSKVAEIAQVHHVMKNEAQERKASIQEIRSLNESNATKGSTKVDIKLIESIINKLITQEKDNKHLLHIDTFFKNPSVTDQEKLIFLMEIATDQSNKNKMLHHPKLKVFYQAMAEYSSNSETDLISANQKLNEQMSTLNTKLDNTTTNFKFFKNAMSGLREKLAPETSESKHKREEVDIRGPS